MKNIGGMEGCNKRKTRHVGVISGVNDVHLVMVTHTSGIIHMTHSPTSTPTYHQHLFILTSHTVRTRRILTENLCTLQKHSLDSKAPFPPVAMMN